MCCERRERHNQRYILYTLSKLSEIVIIDITELLLWFIDYTKARDCETQENNQAARTMEHWWQRPANNKDYVLARNTSARIPKQLGRWQWIKKGVRQECALFPDLFSLHIMRIMRIIEYVSGIAFGGHNITRLCWRERLNSNYRKW